MSEPMRDFEQSTFEDILVTMIENAANRIHKNFKDIATFEEATATIRSTLGQLLEDCEELAAAMYILHECFTDVEKEKEGKKKMTNKEKELLKGGLKTGLKNFFNSIFEEFEELREELEEEIDDFVEELVEYSESIEGDNDGESEGGEDDYE